MTNPNVISELRRIAEQSGGELRAADVVAAARRETSPLHPYFDWKDSDAADKWRLHQARCLIGVAVEYIGTGEEAALTRVFVSLSSDRKEEGGGYRATVAVLSNAEYRKQLLADALAEMKRFEMKYATLKELAEVFSAMRKVRRKRGGTLRRTTAA